MKPKEYVDLLNKLTVKLLFLISSIAVGIVASAILVNSYPEFFFNNYTNGLPTSLILAIPLATFITVQLWLDHIVFSAQIFITGFIVDYLDNRVYVSRRRSEQTESLKSDIQSSLTEEQFKKLTSFDKLGNDAENIAIKTEQIKANIALFVKDIEKGRKKWHDTPAHLHICYMVLKFLYLCILIAVWELNASPLVFVITAISYVYITNHKLVDVAVIVGSLLKNFVLDVFYYDRKHEYRWNKQQRSIRKLLSEINNQ